MIGSNVQDNRYFNVDGTIAGLAFNGYSDLIQCGNH